MAASLAAIALDAQPTKSPRFRKGITSGNFPKGKPLSDCFAEAKAAGFEGVEIALGDQVHLNTPDDDLKRLADAARKNGIAIVNMWVSGAIADTPLNAADPKVRAQGVAGGVPVVLHQEARAAVHGRRTARG